MDAAAANEGLGNTKLDLDNTKTNPMLAATKKGPRIEERKDPNSGNVYYVDMDAGRTAWTREALVEQYEKEQAAKAEEEAGSVDAGASRTGPLILVRRGGGWTETRRCPPARAAFAFAMMSLKRSRRAIVRRVRTFWSLPRA